MVSAVGRARRGPEGGLTSPKHPQKQKATKPGADRRREGGGGVHNTNTLPRVSNAVQSDLRTLQGGPPRRRFQPALKSALALGTGSTGRGTQVRDTQAQSADNQEPPDSGDHPGHGLLEPGPRRRTHALPQTIHDQQKR